MKRKVEIVDIPGYEKLYYLTPDGEVFRYGKCNPLKIHKRKNSSNCRVKLCKNSKCEYVSMSKIIRMCYCKGIDYRFEHKNGDVTDYAFDNLILKRVKRYRLGVGRRKPVVMIKDGVESFYSSIKECAANTFYDRRSISDYCSGHSSPRDDVTFKFADDYF